MITFESLSLGVMMWFETQKIIFYVLMLTSVLLVIPAIVNILRLLVYYLGPKNPRFQKYLFRLNRVLALLSRSHLSTTWNKIYFTVFLLVSLIGAYLLYALLLQIMAKQLSLADSWLKILLAVTGISLALQQLRPQQKKKPR